MTNNVEELKNMLEDVVNELDLSESAEGKHGPRGTSPAELVRLVLEEKDRQIRMLKLGMIPINDIIKTDAINEKEIEAKSEELFNKYAISSADCINIKVLPRTAFTKLIREYMRIFSNNIKNN